MRLPFPERISLLYVVLFATLIFGVQLAEGTSLLFATCGFLFIIMAAIAFNLAGGITRPSGAYVLFYSVLSLIIAFIWKAIIGEPADSNLTVPLVTIRVYLAGICAMTVAVYISRKLATKRAILRNLLNDKNMQNATIGCMVTGTFIFCLLLFPAVGPLIHGSLTQLDRFLPLAIIIGVTRQIRKSGGTSSVSLPVLIAFLVIFVNGVLIYSKEGMFAPILCWFAAASSLRYRMSNQQIIGCLLAVVVIFRYLVPYAQYGRNYRTDSFSENLDTSIWMLSNLGYVREQYFTAQEDLIEDQKGGYFNTPQGFFDRLEMIKMDDSLINITEQGKVFGLSPVVAFFENLIPHVFWPGKPTLYYQTMYAQEIGGIIPEGDTTTGISFTPPAEGFHLARWTGVLVVAPILWIMLFVVFDSLCGDARKSPWGLLAILLFSHAAPEAGLGGAVYLMGFGALSIVFAAYTTAYLMPIVGTLVVGPERRPVHSISGLRNRVPRHIPSPAGSESTTG